MTRYLDRGENDRVYFADSTRSNPVYTLYYYDDVGCVHGFGLQLSHIMYFVIVVAILSSSHRLSLCACFYPCSGPVMN